MPLLVSAAWRSRPGSPAAAGGERVLEIEPRDDASFRKARSPVPTACGRW
jgi:hypothetical protein